MNLFRVCLAIVVVVLASCAERRQSEPLNDLVGADLRSMDEASYRQNAKRIASAIGTEFHAQASEVDGQRLGPWGLWQVDDDVVVASIHLGADQTQRRLLLSRVDASGSLEWTRELPLGAGYRVTAIGVADTELEDLVLEVRASKGRIEESLYFGIVDEDAHLIRVEQGARLINDDVHARHPDMPLYSGRIEGRSGVRALAALVFLANPEGRGARGNSAIRSQVEAWRGSTVIWLAESAARVLTQPH